MIQGHITTISGIVITLASAGSTMTVAYPFTGTMSFDTWPAEQTVPRNVKYSGSVVVRSWREPRAIECRMSGCSDKYYVPIKETYKPYDDSVMYALYLSDGSVLRTHRQRGPLARRVYSHRFRMLLSKVAV